MYDLATQWVSGFVDPRIEGVSAAILRVVLTSLAGIVLTSLAGGLLILGAQFVLERIAWERDRLILDLNELSHWTPGSSNQRTPWRDVYTASAFGSNWLVVNFEHGEYWACRLLNGHRDVLGLIMRELVRHHHPDLYGQVKRHREQLN